ncbi:MAG: methylaspartate ammonia-lyase [Clostridia bacterium]|nr:methylaspartate ammonia-lyase [Clostridia bacterium]
MKIVNVVCAPGRTGFYFDDQKAIKAGAVSDGSAYIGEPVTPGFTAVRQAGESISVMLVLEDGQIAHGDCAAVQYSGTGGRDPLFLAKDFIPVIEEHIKPALVGKEADNFRELTKMMEAIEVDGKKLHTAIRYGVSQAILDAVAKASHRLMAEVVADEYGLTVSEEPIPVFTQSGDSRYDNSDKMIIKQADILPHALINNVDTKLGRDGSILKDYVKWLSDRIIKLRADESYSPILHIDVYGTIGQAFGDDNFVAQADYLAELEEAAKPFKLRIEGPMDAGEREKQMLCLKGLREEFDKCGLAEKVWQYFIAVPDIKSVGVKDESRYEGWPAIIRAVNTKDAMTATIEEIPYEILHKITYRITHEVPGINRVLMDLTPKPIGTIEWE